MERTDLVKLLASEFMYVAAREQIEQQVRASANREPQNRPQNIMILTKRTPKKGLLIFGKPQVGTGTHAVFAEIGTRRRGDVAISGWSAGQVDSRDPADAIILPDTGGRLGEPGGCRAPQSHADDSPALARGV